MTTPPVDHQTFHTPIAKSGGNQLHGAYSQLAERAKDLAAAGKSRYALATTITLDVGDHTIIVDTLHRVSPDK